MNNDTNNIIYFLFQIKSFLFTADCSILKAPDNVVCSGRIIWLKNSKCHVVFFVLIDY